MASSKNPERPAAAYVWPQHPDDPTLGGAIPAELFDRLQSNAPPDPPAPDSSPPES